MTREEVLFKIESLMLVRNYSEAYKLINSYNASYSNDPEYRLLSAKVLANLYHYDEAMHILNDLLDSSNINKSDILREMGLIQEINNSPDTAIKTYKELIKTSPKEQYFAKMRIATLEFKRGNALEAIEILNSIKRNDSGQKDLLLAKIYRAIGLNDQARNVLDNIVVDDNNKALKNKVYLQRAYLDYAEDDFLSAKNNLEKIHTSNEKILLERRVLNNQIFFKSGGSVSSRKSLVNEFKDRSAFRWLTAYVIGDMDFYEKKYDVAKTHYQMAISNSNDYYHKLEAMLKIMRIEFRCENYRAAKACYEKIVADKALGKEANYAMIEECIRIGDIETAKSYYEKITPEQILLDNKKYQRYGAIFGNKINSKDYVNSQISSYSYEESAKKVLSHEIKYSTLTPTSTKEVIKATEVKLSEDNKVGSEGIFDEYLVDGYPTIGYDDEWNELTAFRVKTLIGTKKIVDMIPRVAVDNVFTTKIDNSSLTTK